MYKLNVPNTLTTLRLVFTPIAMWLLMYNHLTWCLALIVAIEVTDFCDGWVARRLNQITDFGKLYDPFCDATFHLMMFLCLVALQILPLWIMAIFLFRELVVAHLRMICMSHKVVMGARPWGKRKANFQAAVLIVIVLTLLVQSTGSWAAIDAGLMALAIALTLIAVAVTIISFVDYAWYVINEVWEE